MAALRDEMDAIFHRYLRDPWDVTGLASLSASLANMPRTDLADSEDEVTVTMELPGVDPKDVDIDIAGEALTVRAETKTEKQEDKKAYHYIERRQGAFKRTVQLPSSIDPTQVDAQYRNGLLTVKIAKKPEAKPKRITVRQA